MVEKLGRAGIGAILDYSVEGGGDENGFEETKNAILQTIQQAELDENIPCACMKMTGIVAEFLLEKMTAGEVLSTKDASAWKRLMVKSLWSRIWVLVSIFCGMPRIGISSLVS